VSFSVVLVTRAGSVPAITGRVPGSGRKPKSGLSGCRQNQRKVFIAPGMAVHRRDDHTPSANTSATSYPPVTFSTCPGERVGQLVMAWVRVWPFR
jgi:hypothetical protein